MLCSFAVQSHLELAWKFLVSIRFGSDVAFVYTLQSAKAIVLSWMNHLLLSPSFRPCRACVKQMVSQRRDDVWLPLRGRRALRRALLLGWRSSTPHPRGGQQPLQEPPVLLPAL